MPKRVKMMTDEQIEALNQPGFYNVGGEPGVYLQVDDDGSRQWILRTIGAAGKRHDIGLGHYPDIEPKEARARAESIKKQIHESKLDQRAAKATGREPGGDEAAESSDTVWVRVEYLTKRFDTSVPTIWRWARSGDFPKPIKIGQNSTRWKLDEILEWEKKKELERK